MVEAGKGGGTAANGEVIEPPKASGAPLPPTVYAEIAAQFNQYTHRPDLLLEAIERHDPGFIKGMNDEARKFARKQRVSRFRFGRAQAYASLVVSIIAALSILSILGWLAYTNALTIWIIIGLGIVYAVTQSGPRGFAEVAKSIVNAIRGGGRDDPGR
jgi:hypothetical protein